MSRKIKTKDINYDLDQIMSTPKNVVLFKCQYCGSVYKLYFENDQIKLKGIQCPMCNNKN